MLPISVNTSSLCFPVNVVVLVLLAVAFLIIVQRNLLNLSDFLHKEHPGVFIMVLPITKVVLLKSHYTCPVLLGNGILAAVCKTQYVFIQMRSWLFPLNQSCLKTPDQWLRGKERRSLSSLLLLRTDLVLWSLPWTVSTTTVTPTSSSLLWPWMTQWTT